VRAFVRPGSVIEDYAVVYLGAAIFKISRLLFIALLSVHFFACIFYRVKEESAAQREDVAAFYTSKNVDPAVSIRVVRLHLP
jgi:hypothetical protein